MGRLTIDRATCTGHGRCYNEAPTLITPDDDGYGVVAVELVAADQAADADRAVLACPERAVRHDRPSEHP